ncbi:MAG: hypothetical protein U1F54_17100 [Burkholderiales bacterium]
MKAFGTARRTLLALFTLAMSSAVLASSSMTYSFVANGTTVAGDSIAFPGGSSGWVKRAYSSNNYSMNGEGGAYSGAAGAIAQVTASVPAQAKVTAVSDGNFELNPPNSSFGKVAGGRVVISFVLEGDITNTATIAGAANVRLTSVFTGTTTQTWSGSLANQPGKDTVSFEITLPLSPSMPADDLVQILPKLTLDVVASVPGGALQTSIADAKDSLKATGFRVYDAQGVQVTGFSMYPSGTIPELAPVAPGIATAIEYYNASYGFYFVTSLPLEISDLDSGKTPGWQRTGQSFNVYTSQPASTVAVCRFYGVFGPKSSHFYAPRGLGCEALLPTNPVWQFEGNVFNTYLPDAKGGCPAGNIPVYRLYNNGQGGAPNHRFTTSAATQAQMIGEGWIPEGTGTGVGMCSPQ